MGLEGCFSHWIVPMLRTSIIQSDLGGKYLTRALSRGTFQVSNISSVFWLIVFNVILRMLDRRGISTYQRLGDIDVKNASFRYVSKR